MIQCLHSYHTYKQILFDIHNVICMCYHAKYVIVHRYHRHGHLLVVQCDNSFTYIQDSLMIALHPCFFVTSLKGYGIRYVDRIIFIILGRYKGQILPIRCIRMSQNSYQNEIILSYFKLKGCHVKCKQTE